MKVVLGKTKIERVFLMVWYPQFLKEDEIWRKVEKKIREIVPVPLETLQVKRYQGQS